MNTKSVLKIALIALAIPLLNVTATFPKGPVGNLVEAAVVHGNWYSTNEDTVGNTPILWSHEWFANIVNTPDGGGPVINPKVEFQTDLELVRFRPDDPSVFAANPPYYTWHFKGLGIIEAAHLPLSAWEAQDTLLAKPRFSASRSVEPEILTDQVTFQTITVTFKLEEALPSGLTYLGIHIGKALIAYEGYPPLVDGTFVSQVRVDDWQETIESGGDQAFWRIFNPSANPSTIEIGKTYTFQATLKCEKSRDLLGSPIFKPDVHVGYNRWEAQPVVTGNSATVTYPGSVMIATFSADNEVDWQPGFSDIAFHFHFEPVVSRVTGKEPPFRVWIPADVRIEPETINLKAAGVITAYVRLPAQYSVNDIVASTVRCQGAPPVQSVIASNTAIFKFKRQDLQNVIPGEKVEFVISGHLMNGSTFEGKDWARVAR